MPSESLAKWAQGTILYRGTENTPIAHVRTIGGLQLNRATADATHLLSELDEVVPTRGSAADIPITGNLIPGDPGQTDLLDDYLKRTLQKFVLAFPDVVGTTWTFYAYVTSFGTGDVNAEGLLGFTATLKPSGVLPDLGVTYSDGLTDPCFVISEGAEVVPEPAGDVYDYIANVLTAVESVTVTPTALAGVIRVNGNIVESDDPSSPITLGEPDSVTTITITVTETNKAARTYTIRVARAAGGE